VLLQIFVLSFLVAFFTEVMFELQGLMRELRDGEALG
jgi:hypothetical protein